MHFWRIDTLTEQLRRGHLEQRAALRYILAWLILWMVVSLPSISGETTPMQPVDWAGYLVTLVATVVGTLLAYQANGGAGGSDFAARYFALGWVVGIRLIVLLLLPSLVFFFIFSFVSAFRAAGGEQGTGDATAEWMIAMFTAVFEIVYYWRLMHYFSIVRETSNLQPTATLNSN